MTFLEAAPWQKTLKKEQVQPRLTKFHLHIPLVHWPWPLGTDKANADSIVFMKQQMGMQLLAGMAPADRQMSRLTQKKEVKGKVLLIANQAV